MVSYVSKVPNVLHLDRYQLILRDAAELLNIGNPGACLLFLKRLSDDIDPGVTIVAQQLRGLAEEMLRVNQPVFVYAEEMLTTGREGGLFYYLRNIPIINRETPKIANIVQRMSLEWLLGEAEADLSDKDRQKIKAILTAILRHKYNEAFVMIARSGLQRGTKIILWAVVPETSRIV